MEAGEVNEGIGANFVSELAGEDCGIGMADSEGDEVSDVAEYRGTDRRGQLIDILVRQGEGEAILACLGEDGGEGFGGEVLELIHHEQEGHAFVLGAAAANDPCVASPAASRRVRPSGSLAAGYLAPLGSDLPENIAEHRRLEQGPDLILDRRDGLPHEARVVFLEFLFPELLHERVTHLSHDPAPVVGIDEHPVHSKQGGVVAVEEGCDAVVQDVGHTRAPRPSGSLAAGCLAPLGWLGHVCRAVGVSGGEMFVRSGLAERCGATDCAISERGCEGFDGIGDDGGAVEGAEFFGIGDGVEGVAEAVGDGAEAEIEGFEDGLAAGMGALFQAAFLFTGGEAFLNSFVAAFLAELLGESHGAGAEGWVANTVNFADEVGPVNWVGAGEEEADEAVEEATGDIGEEVVVPDGVAEETADGVGFEDAKDEDAVGGAADGVEGDGGELDEAEGEVGEEGAEEVE
jgi:hypothetical protein